MKLKQHPRSTDFLKWFTKNKKLAGTLSAVYFRVAGPRHTTATEIVSEQGRVAGVHASWPPVEVNSGATDTQRNVQANSLLKKPVPRTSSP